jgi:DNA-binding transcriptional ArsR family regulator
MDAVRQQVCTAGEIARHFGQVSRPAASRHVRVLRRARMVRAKGVGREQRYEIDTAGLAGARSEWLAQFESIWSDALANLKRIVESERT